jgi:predicted nucleotide-binding protein (sugar kinase/HSP70/actin superfamily)
VKCTFPHMGTMYVAVESLLEGLGHEVVVPPPITERTISLGQHGAPETACLPLKINLGNYIEAMENGAEVILMGGGVGPCRFGYYAEVQREILKDAGYNFEMMVLEPPKGQLSLAWQRFKPLLTKASISEAIAAVRLAWAKAQIVDDIEKLTHQVRAYETVRGSATTARSKAITMLRQAKNTRDLPRLVEEIKALFQQVPVDPQRQPVVIGLVGEIYVMLEPFANRHLERLLGEMGVLVRRSAFLSDWLRGQFFNLLRFDVQKKARLLAGPYLPHFVGGHGLESVADSVNYANNRVDGIIHVAPFTCMPEIVAQSILPKVSADLDVPIMTLVVDEHSAEAGIITRLEAFTDMVRRRRARQAES